MQLILLSGSILLAGFILLPWLFFAFLPFCLFILLAPIGALFVFYSLKKSHRHTLVVIPLLPGRVEYDEALNPVVGLRPQRDDVEEVTLGA